MPVLGSRSQLLPFKLHACRKTAPLRKERQQQTSPSKKDASAPDATGQKEAVQILLPRDRHHGSRRVVRYLFEGAWSNVWRCRRQFWRCAHCLPGRWRDDRYPRDPCAIRKLLLFAPMPWLRTFKAAVDMRGQGGSRSGHSSDANSWSRYVRDCHPRRDRIGAVAAMMRRHAT